MPEKRLAQEAAKVGVTVLTAKVALDYFMGKYGRARQNPNGGALPQPAFPYIADPNAGFSLQDLLLALAGACLAAAALPELATIGGILLAESPADAVLTLLAAAE
ncbi:MAG: hypothetical protein ACYDBJ_06200 [Aggregatilineales bacterium]